MTKKLNILFLCGWYPSRILPNNGDFIQHHAEAVSLLHNVTVLHIISDGNTKKNIAYSSKNINGVKTHITYIKSSKNPFTKTFRFYTAFKETLKQIGDFDIVHLHEIFPFGLFTFLIKKPLVISEHWTGYHQPQAQKINDLQLFFSRLIVKRAQFVCPVSLELQNSMEAIKLKGNYKVIHNVVNTDIFQPKKKIKNTVFTILHISNMLDEHKNVSGIIRAVSKLNFNYQLILIGKKSLKYKSISDKEGITDKIKFINHLPHEEIPAFLQQADVYISFSNYETWGIVMVEALACETPVISTNTGILNELNLTKFATIIKKKDENALTEAILKYQKLNHTDTNEMFNFVEENFSPKQIAKELSKLYFKTLC